MMLPITDIKWSDFQMKKAWPSFDGPCVNTFTDPPTVMKMRFSKCSYEGRSLQVVTAGKVVKPVTEDDRYGSGLSFQFKPVSTDFAGIEHLESVLSKGDDAERLCAAVGFEDFFEEYKLKMMLGDTSQLRVKLKEDSDGLEFDSWNLLQGELDRLVTLHSGRIDMYVGRKFDFGN